MSVTYCMGRAIQIGRLPSEKWEAETKKLPEICERDGCAGSRNCRALVEDFLLTQWRCMENKKQIAEDIAAGRIKSAIVRRPGP